jgi:predicted hotdog family 3-hydroxylacyl-ACP dehydratase
VALIEGPPAVESLLPHRDPARLLRVVVEASLEPVARISGIAVIPPNHPLVRGGRAPAFLGLEAAAQAAAALEALSRQGGPPGDAGNAGPRLGYLVGVREAVFHAPDLPAAEPLTVTVEAAGSAPPLAVYTARIEREGAVLVTGTFSTYIVS